MKFIESFYYLAGMFAIIYSSTSGTLEPVVKLAFILAGIIFISTAWILNGINAIIKLLKP